MLSLYQITCVFIFTNCVICGICTNLLSIRMCIHICLYNHYTLINYNKHAYPYMFITVMGNFGVLFTIHLEFANQDHYIIHDIVCVGPSKRKDVNGPLLVYLEWLTRKGLSFRTIYFLYYYCILINSTFHMNDMFNI